MLTYLPGISAPQGKPVRLTLRGLIPKSGSHIEYLEFNIQISVLFSQMANSIPKRTYIPMLLLIVGLGGWYAWYALGKTIKQHLVIVQMTHLPMTYNEALGLSVGSYASFGSKHFAGGVLIRADVEYSELAAELPPPPANSTHLIWLLDHQAVAAFVTHKKLFITQAKRSKPGIWVVWVCLSKGLNPSSMDGVCCD
jgi:hypothetical protein